METNKDKLIIHLKDVLKNLQATEAYLTYAIEELEKNDN